MKRSYILPSELSNRHEHDCRSDSAKFLDRSLLFDVSVFATLMAHTRSSINLFYDSSLYKPELLGADPRASPTHAKNKCLKEAALNSANYGSLIWADSLTCSSNGDIFLCDRLQHRVLAFNKELIYKYSLGAKGSEPGRFHEPSSVCMSEANRLYVADRNNSRVQVFAECKRSRDKSVRLVEAGKAATTASSLKSTKVVGEFAFSSCIELEDKPVRLCASPFSGTMAVSTENGMIFVFNEWNEITAYLKLRRPLELANILSFCLDDFGQRLTHFQHDDLEQTIKIRVYQTQAKNPVERSSKQPYKMHLIDEKDLQTNYFPGIRLTRVTSMKLSLDSKHFLIFDSLNLNLLEFDLNGRFTRIVLKAEERLGQVLAFDFNGDHLVTSEIDSNKRSLLEEERKRTKSSQDLSLDGTPSEIERRKLSKAHVFKLRTFRYMECQCHRHLDAEPKQAAKRADKDYENNYTKSFSFD